MKALKKIAAAALFATTAAMGATAMTSDANADHHGHLYSYDTRYGYIQFHNNSGHWPVLRRVRYDGAWYDCSFWSNRYSCERGRSNSHGGGYGNSYGGGSRY